MPCQVSAVRAAVVTVFLLIAAITPTSSWSQNNSPQIQTDPAAVAIMTEALNTMQGGTKITSGFHIGGIIQPASSQASSQEFQADSFTDGFRMDLKKGDRKIHIESRGERLLHTNSSSRRPIQAADLWSPRLDYFPLHGWWTEFGGANVSTQLLSSTEIIDGESCQHIQLILPAPPPLTQQTYLHRYEDVFIGSSSHLIRRIQYRIPLGTSFLRTATVSLNFSQFESFGALKQPTVIRRLINEIPIDTMNISSVSSASSSSISRVQ